jgi:hypothetical protein
MRLTTKLLLEGVVQAFFKKIISMFQVIFISKRIMPRKNNKSNNKAKTNQQQINNKSKKAKNTTTRQQLISH